MVVAAVAGAAAGVAVAVVRQGARQEEKEKGEIPLPARSMRREKSDRGKRFCFAFNSGQGCDKCEVGQGCPNGIHLCCICPRDANHSCVIHWNGSAYTPQY